MSNNYPAITKNADQSAVDVPTDTTDFGTILSPSDTDVQKALDTLDDNSVPVFKPAYEVAISALTLVRASGDCEVTIANNDTYDNAAVLGLAIDTGGIGFNGRVVAQGKVSDVSFTFGENVTLYLGTSGTITDIAPATGALTRIGRSLGNGSIFINIDDPIEL